MLRPSYWVCVLVLAASPPARAQDVLTNGSFESGPSLGGSHDVTVSAGSTAITGWTVVGDSIDYTGPPWDVADGVHCVDLDGRDAIFSGVQQSFTTVPGRTYVVSFKMSGNPEGPPQIKRFRVSVDQFTGDYEFDSGGQTIGALRWEPVTFSFAASGSSTTLSFVSLSATPSSYGALIDQVSVLEAPPGCEYTFSAGSGASLTRFCLTANGTIVHLEAPAGQEHIAVGQVWEGYVVCSGGSAQAWDLTSTSDGFGAPVLLSGPTDTSVTIRRVNAQYQLDQRFVFDKKGSEITIAMTLTNISGATLPDVRVMRAYDPDVNGDFGDDLEVKSARSVWASDTEAVVLTGITRTLATDTAVGVPPIAMCSPPGSTWPLVSGDGSLATVTYRVGNMRPGAKKQVVFAYRVQ